MGRKFRLADSFHNAVVRCPQHCLGIVKIRADIRKGIFKVCYLRFPCQPVQNRHQLTPGQNAVGPEEGLRHAHHQPGIQRIVHALMVPSVGVQVRKGPAGTILASVAGTCCGDRLNPDCAAPRTGIGNFPILGLGGLLRDDAVIPDMFAGGRNPLHLRLVADGTGIRHLAIVDAGRRPRHAALVPAVPAGSGYFLRLRFAAQDAGINPLTCLCAGGLFAAHAFVPKMVFIDGQIQRCGGNMVRDARLAVLILIHLLVFSKITGQGKLRIFHRQRLLGEGNIGCHIPVPSVGILRRHLKPGCIQSLSHLVFHGLRLRLHLQLRDDAAEAHEITGIVFEIEIAVVIGNGTANGVLSLGAVGCE